MTLIIDPVSKATLLSALDSGTHAIMLTGPKGVGLRTIAIQYASPQYIVAPVFLTKTSTTKQIGIDQIRDLYQQTRTKHASLQTVLIDDADMMTHAAQNSLLKLLEEPSAMTRFILTSHVSDTLLPTIRSRLQTIHIVATPGSTAALVTDVKPALKRQQLSFIADGLPAEMQRLLADEQYFRDVAHRAGVAKQLVELPVYERLTLVQQQKFTRNMALELLEQVAIFLQRKASVHSVARINIVLQAHEAIQRGGSIKLNLARAMVY